MAIFRTNIYPLVLILIVGIAGAVNITSTDSKIFGIGKRRSPPPPHHPPTKDYSNGPPASGRAPAPMSDVVRETIYNMVYFVKDCALYINSLSPKAHRPNEQCCERARKVDIMYFCAIFFVPNSQVAFNARKVAIVAKDCGKPLKKRTFCGTYWVNGKE